MGIIVTSVDNDDTLTLVTKDDQLVEDRPRLKVTYLSGATP